MDQRVVVTSLGAHHETFAMGRAHVLVIARNGISAHEIDAAFAARHWMENSFPDGHVVLLDMRSVTGAFSRTTREVIGAHARVQRTGHIRARAVLVPDDRHLADRLRGFVTAYTQAPGMRCPDCFVHTVAEACAFVAPFILDQPIDTAGVAAHLDEVRAELSVTATLQRDALVTS